MSEEINLWTNKNKRRKFENEKKTFMICFHLGYHIHSFSLLFSLYIALCMFSLDPIIHMNLRRMNVKKNNYDMVPIERCLFWFDSSWHFFFSFISWKENLIFLMEFFFCCCCCCLHWLVIKIFGVFNHWTNIYIFYIIVENENWIHQIWTFLRYRTEYPKNKMWKRNFDMTTTTTIPSHTLCVCVCVCCWLCTVFFLVVYYCLTCKHTSTRQLNLRFCFFLFLFLLNEDRTTAT